MSAAPVSADWQPTLAWPGARYVVFFGVYLYQGLVAGFSLTALANHYAGIGIPASEVGLHFAIAGLPWTLQPILWGPLIDRAGGARMGRRRVWAFWAVLGAQASLGLLWFVPGPEALGWVGLAFLGHSLFAALLDTACDRMIMDHVPEDAFGRMSGCTRGGFVIGTSLSAAVFSTLLASMSFYGCIAVLMALSTLALLPLVIVREAPGDALVSLARRADGTARQTRSFRSFLLRLLVGLRRPTALRLLVLCFCVDFILSLFEVRFNVEVVQAHGWDAAALSRLQAGLALASGTVGALVIGVWSDRAGPLPALTGLFLGGAATFGTAAMLIGADRVATAAPLILGLTNVLPTLLVVALVPALMRASRGRPGAATQFEVFMATMNLGSVGGGGVSGLSAEILPSGAVAGLVGLVFLTCAGLSRRPALLFENCTR
ncbi:MFS transporter [Methylobacterium haplocladii]|uniref:MFS transporter n=1 Tax=Methylobacterium haplocladii TaxID=1176176 RepID=A0A512IPQ5_9HYPH|nr:MFS transporter [Methylobacterium haplocladii]GEO99691.1 hypothetical protein MHA02_20790 [Methylobacterium haplocladii]GJD84678.1 hypothetical protein HPGCJGGD_2558 [Methylobacterium haplocladii]GLS61203.1 hypothetical protein GCM10007887_39010 [Methylobacterium haplocladii]